MLNSEESIGLGGYAVAVQSIKNRKVQAVIPGFFQGLPHCWELWKFWGFKSEDRAKEAEDSVR